MRKKGTYLVTEPGCFEKGSGAYRHIQVGLNMLSFYFSIHLLTPFAIQSESGFTSIITDRKKDNWIRRVLKQTGFWGTIKDIIIIISNNIQVFALYKRLKKERTSFIYERVAYLDFRGLLVAKLLGVPHFYEANGLQFQRMEKYYGSLMKPIVRWLEKCSYKNSNYVFFVGTYGQYWNLQTNNWSNIENGVEETHLKYFSEHSKVFEEDINICFIARLMTHHRPEILIQGLLGMDKRVIHLHLIGSGLEVIEKALENKIKITNHGYKDREAIRPLLRRMHIGIIPGSPEFTSTMKIFDYGGAKCAVLGPDITNFKSWFSDEMLFFKDNDPDDFAKVLNDLVGDNKKIMEYGTKLYELINNKFTWSRIYDAVGDKMEREIEKYKE